jgi:hypothetical protein
MEINFYNLFIEQHTSSSNTAKCCVGGRQTKGDESG